MAPRYPLNSSARGGNTPARSAAMSAVRQIAPGVGTDPAQLASRAPMPGQAGGAAPQPVTGGPGQSPVAASLAQAFHAIVQRQFDPEDLQTVKDFIDTLSRAVQQAAPQGATAAPPGAPPAG